MEGEGALRLGDGHRRTSRSDTHGEGMAKRPTVVALRCQKWDTKWAEDFSVEFDEIDGLAAGDARRCASDAS